MLTLPAPPIWQAFDHPLGCQASVATCGGSGPSSRRKRVVLLAKFYGYSVMWPWGDSFKGFHKQVWISQSCTEESEISFSMSRSASFLHVQKTAVTFGQSRLRETGCWAMESEQLDAIFFQLYHLGCPPASGLDPFHSSARIYGPRVNRYPPSRDCWKAQSELWIHEKNVGVILQCGPSTYLSTNPYIFIYQYIYIYFMTVLTELVAEILALIILMIIWTPSLDIDEESTQSVLHCVSGAWKQFS